MIVRDVVDGRPCIVTYLRGDDWSMAAPPDATLVKLRFTDDRGGVWFLKPKRALDADDWDDQHEPAVSERATS